MKILIVDDNIGMRKIIRQSVCSDNDTIIECNGGEEAISAYIKHQPDYVLMDIEMKSMNGISATKKIREDFS